jgi:diguanylate cyclase (GGDEF)-like protein
LSRLLWPIGVLFVCTLAFGITTFVWTSDHADRVAAEGQRERLASALQLRLDAIREEFAAALVATAAHGANGDVAFRTKSRPAVPPRPFPGFDGAALLSPTLEPSGKSFFGQPDPATFGLVRSLLAGMLPTLRSGSEAPPAGEAVPPPRLPVDDDAQARFLSDGTSHFAVVAIPASRLPPALARAADPSDTLIAWIRFGDDRFAKIARLQRLEDFRIEQANSAPSYGLPLLDGEGQIAAALTWTPDRPGDKLKRNLASMIVLGFCGVGVLFGAVALYFHLTTRNLAETDAISKELLGRDPLSGLSNRALFNDRLDMELERLTVGGTTNAGLAVMFIDLDRFKDVNDTYGHQAGDELIRLVAQRLMEALSEKDTLARFGGDEFAVIQTDVRSIEPVEALAKRIQDTLSRPFEVAHAQVTVGASIGVAMAPEQATDREGLMKLADAALYQAKSEGRNRTSFFQSRMDEALKMRKVVEDDLRRAIEADELVLHYQPLFSSDGENIVGLEALVRWPHAKQGLISPADFIPLAEERGLVIPLGEWVLRRACEDGKRWPGMRIAVNVSPIQFRHRDFVGTVMRVLSETGFEASRLELELTEGVVVEDADAAEAAMVELRALGVHLALDDFGTGYSSLIYLRRFAFDKIKIDRSFLESMEATGESAILVHSIVHLGRALGLIVTAEGVETREQHRFLQALGCHQLQGYLFSRPVARETIDTMLVPRSASLPADAA